MDINGKRVLTISQFCHAYSVKRSKAYLLWSEGLGPQIIRIGRRVYIAVDDAEEWVAAHRVKRVAA